MPPRHPARRLVDAIRVVAGMLLGRGRFGAAVPAMVIGGAGYLGAETLILTLLAHTHDAAPGTTAGVPHVHDQGAAFAVLAMCLTLIPVLTAAVVVAGTVTGSTRASRTVAPTAIRWASGLSIWTFVLGHFASYAAATQTVTHSALLLVVGGAVQMFIGAAAGLLWWRWLEAARQPGRRPFDAAPRAQRPAISGVRPPARMHRRWWAAPAAGRAPPALTA